MCGCFDLIGALTIIAAPIEAPGFGLRGSVLGLGKRDSGGAAPSQLKELS